MSFLPNKKVLCFIVRSSLNYKRSFTYFHNHKNQTHMIPAAFDYVAPATLEEALALLEEHGDEAKILAGNLDRYQ